MRLYVDHEHHDGYLRDGCFFSLGVFSLENDIFDKMAAQITYANGVQVSYSCTTYSPYEGGPASPSTERPHRKPGPDGGLDQRASALGGTGAGRDPDYRQLRGDRGVGDSSCDSGGHGGGDTRMTDKIWREPAGRGSARAGVGGEGRCDGGVDWVCGEEECEEWKAGEGGGSE